jgi:hypothetical protein
MALDPVTAVLDIGGKLIDRLWPDPATRDAAKLEMLRLAQQGDLAEMTAQTEINKTEASNPNWFVAGWRPYIGWICGTGLGYQFLVYPILVAWVPKIVQLDMGTLITLLAGMLGLSVSRTLEKKAGVA